MDQTKYDELVRKYTVEEQEIPKGLELFWNPYQQGDFQLSFKRSIEALAGAAGIDLLHIAGLSLMNMRRHNEGLVLLKAAAGLRPTSSHIYVNAAYLAEQSGLLEEVNYFTDRGLVDFPDDLNLILLKANNLVVHLNFEEAEKLYRNILEKDPDHVQSLINLGNVCRARDDFDAAEKFFDQADKLEPNSHPTIFARATMVSQRGQDEEAIKLLEPIAHDVDAQFLLALLYLSRGDYERGFRFYRARSNAIWYKTGNFAHPLNPFDHWTEAADKDIAIIQEGGLGDMIQYMRYMPTIAEITKSITQFVPASMLRLMQHNLPEKIVFETSYEKLLVDKFDYMTTDVEMAYHFRTTLDTIPVQIPYIFVPKEMIEQRLLPPTSLKRVGLCWAGGERDNLNQRSYDIRRSINNLKMLALLADISGIEFVSLQYGPRANDEGMNLVRVIDDSFDFLDTAAIIAQLDLVITVDTSIVHLAGAMGKPTWLLSRYDGCWRWQKNRPDAPWYPGVVRVFGQKSYRDWSVPLAEITQELRKLVNG